MNAYKIMKHRISSSLRKDKQIIVSFVTKDNVIRTKNRIEKQTNTKRVILNDSFISHCKSVARQEKKSHVAVIIDQLFKMKHDDNATYFIVQ